MVNRYSLVKITNLGQGYDPTVEVIIDEITGFINLLRLKREVKILNKYQSLQGGWEHYEIKKIK